MVLLTGGHAQGLYEFDESKFGKDRVVFEDLNSWIKDNYGTYGDPWEAICEKISAVPEAVIISEQVGCGIVPADPLKRAFREKLGRLQIRLAEKADEVYRVTCGIGQKIK